MSVLRGWIPLLVVSVIASAGGCVQGGIDDDAGVGDAGEPDDGGDGTGDDAIGDDGTGDDGAGDGGADGGDGVDGGDGGSGIVDPIGTSAAVDIAAWNIENFPADGNTPALVADLILSLRLDLVAVEEIANLDAFDELMGLLPGYRSLLSLHEYSPGNFQKVGYIYRDDLLDVDPQGLLFQDDSFQFPRPPFQVEVAVPGAAGGSVRFVAIVVHLKAGIGDDDRERRRQAMVTLEQHIRGLVDGGTDQVILLGDYNEVLTSDAGRAVFAPFLEAPDRYRVQTQALAESGAFSFVPSHVVLDHIVTTVALDDEVGGSDALIPRLDVEVTGYVDRVSDHLPVSIAMPILP